MTPAEGILTERFDIRSGSLGVRIAATEGTRRGGHRQRHRRAEPLDARDTGWIVEVQHPGNLLSVYRNLSQSLVTAGQTVRAGEVIGLRRGRESDGSKLRLFGFELVWNDGKPVDPEGYIVF